MIGPCLIGRKPDTIEPSWDLESPMWDCSDKEQTIKCIITEFQERKFSLHGIEWNNEITTEPIK